MPTPHGSSALQPDTCGQHDKLYRDAGVRSVAGECGQSECSNAVRMFVRFFMGKVAVNGWTVVSGTFSRHLIMCIGPRAPTIAIIIHRFACASAVFIASCLSANASEDSVLIFTDRLHPVSASGNATVIELDAPQRIESRLSAQLPGNAGQAAALVRQRLHSGGRALDEQFERAYQGVVDAWQLGVYRLPAVVVGRRWVVYGDPDVAHALVRIAAWQVAHP